MRTDEVFCINVLKSDSKKNLLDSSETQVFIFGLVRLINVGI